MMAHGKLRELRALAVAQIMMELVKSFDPKHFVETGELNAHEVVEKMPYDPNVAKHIALIEANGGKFVMPEGV